jgi:hypothetical protein
MSTRTSRDPKELPSACVVLALKPQRRRKRKHSELAQYAKKEVTTAVFTMMAHVRSVEQMSSSSTMMLSEGTGDVFHA